MESTKEESSLETFTFLHSLLSSVTGFTQKKMLAFLSHIKMFQFRLIDTSFVQQGQLDIGVIEASEITKNGGIILGGR